MSLRPITLLKRKRFRRLVDERCCAASAERALWRLMPVATKASASPDSTTFSSSASVVDAGYTFSRDESPPEPSDRSRSTPKSRYSREVAILIFSSDSGPV